MITVNIITYKAPMDMLIDSIQNLVDGCVIPSETLINVINNGPRHYVDSIEQKIQHSEDVIPIRIINNGPDCRHLSQSWNKAISESSSEYVIIMSDDVEALSEWDSDFRIKASKEYDLICPSFSFFCIKKSAHSKIGGFDERFKGGGFEDNDYLLRMIEAGAKCSFDWGLWKKDPIKKLFIHYHGEDKSKYNRMGREWSFQDQDVNRKYFMYKYATEYDFYRKMYYSCKEKEIQVKPIDEIPKHLIGIYNDLLGNSIL